MQKTIWLAYDLGVRGDYSTLYRWLDEVKAVECGDSLACIKLDIPEDSSAPEYVKTTLQANITFSRSDRIYVIWLGADGRNNGRFIIGGRKASPWQGYDQSKSIADDR